MFQFPTFAYLYRYDTASLCRVAPFRNLRINWYLLIPVAYRSLSRLSSPPRAKASAMRPYLLSYRSSPPQSPHKGDVRRSPMARCSFFFTLLLLSQYVNDLLFSFTLYVIRCTFWIVWRITDSNRWPSACKADALASWANPPLDYSS